MYGVFQLKEGVYLHYYKTGKFKTNTTAVLISAEMKAENAAKTALAAQVMKSGARKYPSQRAMAVKLEEMNGAVFDVSIIKKGNRQLIYIFFESVAGTFSDGADFIKEVIFYPVNFSGSGFSKAKDRLICEIEAVKDNKSEYALERMAEEMENGAYSIPGLGYAEEAAALKPQMMKRFYSSLLTTGIIDVYFVGSEDVNTVRKKYESLFGRTRCNIKRIAEQSLKPKFKEAKTVKEEQGLNQGKLCMCYSTGEEASKENILSILVLNEIIGGSGGSLLFSKVREKEGLCYSIGSTVNKHKMLMVIEAGIDKNDRSKVTGIIKKSIEEIKSGITEEEVLKAKENISKNYDSVFDTPASIINYGFTMRLLGITDTPKEFAEEIKAVTVKEVKEMAEKLKCETEYFLV